MQHGPTETNRAGARSNAMKMQRVHGAARVVSGAVSACSFCMALVRDGGVRLNRTVGRRFAAWVGSGRRVGSARAYRRLWSCASDDFPFPPGVIVGGWTWTFQAAVGVQSIDHGIHRFDRNGTGGARIVQRAVALSVIGGATHAGAEIVCRPNDRRAGFDLVELELISNIDFEQRPHPSRRHK